MLVMTGVFENRTFIPDKPVSIPQKTKVKVTIEEEPPDIEAYAQKWREIGEAVLNSSEELSGEPVPVRFRTPDEIDAL